MIKSTLWRDTGKRPDRIKKPLREEEPATEASVALETALAVGRGEEPEEGELQAAGCSGISSSSQVPWFVFSFILLLAPAAPAPHRRSHLRDKPGLLLGNERSGFSFALTSWPI